VDEAAAPNGPGTARPRSGPRPVRLVTAVLVLACGLLMYRTLQTSRVEEDRTVPLLLFRRAGPVSALPTDRQGTEDITARKAAVRRLERNPYDAEALTTLAALVGQGGEGASQSRLVHQLSRITRRSTAGEVWLFQEGLQSGRYDQAIRSLDLLARRKAVGGSLLAFELSKVLDQPAARRALSTVLLQDPVWGADLLRRLSQAAPPHSVDSLLIEMTRSGKVLDDALVEPALRRHVSGRDYPAARRLWTVIYSSGANRNRVHDGGFDGLAGPPPFNWQVATPGGGLSRWKPDPGEVPGFLTARHDLYGSSAPLISQLLFLPGGAYELAVKARSLSGQPHRRFRLDLSCFPGPRLVTSPLAMAPGAWRSTASRFVVPDQDCELQSIRVRPVIGERPQPVEIQLDEIVIQPAAGPPGVRGVP
jgi:hypothetical protein